MVDLRILLMTDLVMVVPEYPDSNGKMIMMIMILIMMILIVMMIMI